MSFADFYVVHLVEVSLTKGLSSSRSEYELGLSSMVKEKEIQRSGHPVWLWLSVAHGSEEAETPSQGP